MRCIECDAILADNELKIKTKAGDYLDTCVACMMPEPALRREDYHEYQHEQLSSKNRRFFQTPD